MISKQLLDLWNRYKPTIAVDAIEYDRELKKLLSTNPASLGTDAISRKDALEAFGLSEKTRKYGGDHSGYDTMMMYEIQDTIENLPPIQPKRGQWIDDGSELGCQCSQCGKTLDEYINCGTEYMTLTEIPKFCPNCGADMRGEQE